MSEEASGESHDAPDPQSRRSRFLLISLVGGVALVVVIALIAVFVRSAPAQYDERTPEGVVQRYAQAVVDGDIDTALTYLVPEIADSCEEVPAGTEDVRVTLLETTEREDSARVEVLVATVYGSGPLGTSEYEYESAFRLVKVGDDWRIRSAPWEFVVCAETGTD